MSPPDLSVAAPCFNEAEGLPAFHAAVTAALADAGVDYELILVDNGSTDATPAVLRGLAAADPRVRLARVPVNRGYGLGVRTGLAAARGRFVGWLDADNQVDPRALVDLHRGLAEGRGGFAVGRRVDRPDGWRRRLASVGYNALVRALFAPGVPDVNGKPKLLRRADLPLLDLASDDWFVDTELVVKLRRLGRRPFVAPVAASPRATGRSHVRLGTARELAARLLAMRLGRPPRGTPVAPAPEPEPASEPGLLEVAP